MCVGVWVFGGRLECIIVISCRDPPPVGEMDNMAIDNWQKRYGEKRVDAKSRESHLFQGLSSICSLDAHILLEKGDIRIDQTTDHGDVDADKVEHTEDVVTANVHAHVRYDDILQNKTQKWVNLSLQVKKPANPETYLKTPNNGGGQGGIVERTEYGRVHEKKAHNTGENKGDDKTGCMPVLKASCTGFPVVKAERDTEKRNNHKEGIVVEKTVFAEILQPEKVQQKIRVKNSNSNLVRNAQGLP